MNTVARYFPRFGSASILQTSGSSALKTAVYLGRRLGSWRSNNIQSAFSPCGEDSSSGSASTLLTADGILPGDDYRRLRLRSCRSLMARIIINVLQSLLYVGGNAITLGNLRFRGSAVASRANDSHLHRIFSFSFAMSSRYRAGTQWQSRSHFFLRPRCRSILAPILFRLDWGALVALVVGRLERCGRILFDNLGLARFKRDRDVFRFAEHGDWCLPFFAVGLFFCQTPKANHSLERIAFVRSRLLFNNVQHQCCRSRFLVLVRRTPARCLPLRRSSRSIHLC